MRILTIWGWMTKMTEICEKCGLPIGPKCWASAMIHMPEHWCECRKFKAQKEKLVSIEKLDNIVKEFSKPQNHSPKDIRSSGASPPEEKEPDGNPIIGSNNAGSDDVYRCGHRCSVCGKMVDVLDMQLRCKDCSLGSDDNSVPQKAVQNDICENCGYEKRFHEGEKDYGKTTYPIYCKKFKAQKGKFVSLGVIWYET